MKLWRLRPNEIDLLMKESDRERIKAGGIAEVTGKYDDDKPSFKPELYVYNICLFDNAFKKELNYLLSFLSKTRERLGPLYSRIHLERYLILHPAFRIPKSENFYGFKVSSKKNTYLFKLDFREGFDNVIIYCFETERFKSYSMWRSL